VFIGGKRHCCGEIFVGFEDAERERRFVGFFFL